MPRPIGGDQVAVPGVRGLGGAHLRFGNPAAPPPLPGLGPGFSVNHQAWDGADRLVEQHVSVAVDPSPQTLQTLQRRTFGYRSDGYLTSITDSRSGSRSFSLDPAGRVSSVTGENWREAYAYDGAGNLAAADWPTSDPTRSAAIGDRSYTGARLQRAGRVGYEYDGQGRLTRQTRRLLSGGNRVWQMEFRCKPGTYGWLKQWETKPTNEPGRFELPAGEIERFNKRVEETTVTKVERGNAGKRRRR